MDIGGFVPFTLQDYPGTIAAMIFTQGCNFCCPYCHNKGLIPRARPGEHASQGHVETILDFLESRKGRLAGVVISGGEPTIQVDLIEFCLKVKSLGYLVKLDTNGTNPTLLSRLVEAKVVDFVAMDIKAPWRKYDVVTGVDVDCSKIRRSIQTISMSGIPHVFRTTLVPGLLDEKDLQAIKASLPSSSTHVVQPFRHPMET